MLLIKEMSRHEWVNPFMPRVCIGITVIWAAGLMILLQITLKLNEIEKYLKESCWLASHQQFSLKYFLKIPFVREISPNIYILVLGQSSIIIDNQSFTSLILINRLRNWQSMIIGKGDN